MLSFPCSIRRFGFLWLTFNHTIIWPGSLAQTATADKSSLVELRRSFRARMMSLSSYATRPVLAIQ